MREKFYSAFHLYRILGDTRQFGKLYLTVDADLKFYKLYVLPSVGVVDLCEKAVLVLDSRGTTLLEGPWLDDFQQICYDAHRVWQANREAACKQAYLDGQAVLSNYRNKDAVDTLDASPQTAADAILIRLATESVNVTQQQLTTVLAAVSATIREYGLSIGLSDRGFADFLDRPYPPEAST